MTPSILKNIDSKIINEYSVDRSFNHLAKGHLRCLLEETPDIWSYPCLHYPAHIECFFWDNKLPNDLHDRYIKAYRLELLKVLNQFIKDSKIVNLSNEDKNDPLLDRVNKRIDHLNINYSLIEQEAIDSLGWL